MRKRLKKTFTQTFPAGNSLNVYNAFDIVGDIAITKVPNSSEANGKAIAETIIRVHRNIKTVLVQDSPVAGNFRIRRLKHVADENKTQQYTKKTDVSSRWTWKPAIFLHAFAMKEKESLNKSNPMKP